MAVLAGNLWEYNLVNIVVLDVTDDYKLFQAPLPAHCYPILARMSVPHFAVDAGLQNLHLVNGYLYDWHEKSEQEDVLYVAMVKEEIVQALIRTI